MKYAGKVTTEVTVYLSRDDLIGLARSLKGPGWNIAEWNVVSVEVLSERGRDDRLVRIAFEEIGTSDQFNVLHANPLPPAST